MIKLVIDCRMLGASGIGVYLRELLPFLLKDFECYLLGNRETLSSFLTKNTYCIDCNIKMFSLKEMFFFPSTILQKINACDVYFTPYCNVPCGIKIKVFTTIHDLVFLDIKGLTSILGVIVRFIIYKRAVILSKAIFTVSQFSLQRIRVWLTHKKPIIVTCNGVSQSIKKYCDNMKNVEKDGSLLFVGNIKKHKGIKVLLDAFSLLQKEGFVGKLVIVGSIKNFRTKDNSVIQLLSSLQKDSVIFTGQITDEELVFLYKKALALIQPSYYEGFGIPPLEALYCGTNTVLSDIPVFKELYSDFAVNFFKCGDSNDLARVIMSLVNTAFIAPQNTDRYTYEKASTVICSYIKNAVYDT